jgi:hypothetical protein
LKKFIGDDVPSELSIIGQARLLALAQALRCASERDAKLFDSGKVKEGTVKALVRFATGPTADRIAEILLGNAPVESFLKEIDSKIDPEKEDDFIDEIADEELEQYDFGVVESPIEISELAFA